MTIVITFGTYDTFHYGHWNLLYKASQYGKLYVFVSTDEFNMEKGKKCYLSANTRAGIVGSLSFVDYVGFEHSWEQKEQVIKDLSVLDNDILLIMGSDWTGKFDSLPCRVLYLPRTNGISSSLIKESVKNENV